MLDPEKMLGGGPAGAGTTTAGAGFEAGATAGAEGVLRAAFAAACAFAETNLDGSAETQNKKEEYSTPDDLMHGLTYLRCCYS